MKKLILVFMVMVSALSFAEEVKFSQEELQERMMPFLRNGKTYEKFKEIEAMEAKGGEVIETITSDGLETRNTAKKGDYIVRNTTGAREMYILKRDKFNKRYEYKDKTDGEWKMYRSVGRIKGVRVGDELIRDLEVEDEFDFMAPWGERMIVKRGDYLVSPLDYSEVYRIAEKEFFETYKEVR